MAQAIGLKEICISEFESRFNRVHPKIDKLKKDAIEEFRKKGFPTIHDESWKHTNISKITQAQFKPATRQAAPDYAQKLVDSFALNEQSAAQIVFINGFYSPELSSQNLDNRIIVESLEKILSANGMLESKLLEHLGSYAYYKNEVFTALNTAFISDGAFVYIPRRVIVDKPIHIIYLSTESKAFSSPRTLIIADENSHAAVVETYIGADELIYLTNAVTEIIAGDTSIIDHYTLGLEGKMAYHIGALHIAQNNNSRVSASSISLGGELVRNNVSSYLGGERSESTLTGLYLAGDGQHIDNYTTIGHIKPGCKSHELYKGILSGASRTVFRGKIYVHKDAQKTDAYQSNKNLLLSEESIVNTKPQLEIYANDVKCSHGATVGQINEEALFYLRSRGIGIKPAYQILLQAFAHDIIDRVKIAPLRDKLYELTTEKLDALMAESNFIDAA